MPEPPTISVTGTGLANGLPDQCRVLISLNHMAETAADALTAIAESSTTAIAALADIEIEQCEVRTVGLSVQDFFDQAQQKVTAHVGSYQLEVIVRPIDDAGGVLGSLSSAVGDALQIRGISLTIADPEPLKSAARRLAIQDAKRRAAEIADEMGVQLGAVLSIQDQSGGPVGFVQTAALPMKMSSNVPIEAGSVSTTSAVTLTYAIEG
jgi:uncharacterized protein